LLDRIVSAEAYAYCVLTFYLFNKHKGNITQKYHL